MTTNNLYLKFKENNENDMAAQVFWAVFYSSRWPSQIGPTADFDGAAITPHIFSMDENDVTLLILKARLISLPLFSRIFTAIMINISIGTITRRTYTINQFGYNAI